jgi:hypothetical protein
MNEMWVTSTDGIALTEETSSRTVPVLKLLCPPQVTYEPVWERTRPRNDVFCLQTESTACRFVARLSALRTSRLYPPGNIPGTHFC